MDNQNTFSPAPQVATPLLSFPDAIKEVMAGFRITRQSWNNSDEYGILADGWLTIHINGAFNVWKVNDGDLLANDWMVI